jgi:LysR family transcriptional regulator, glycine cleavage system transcriptional activator
MRKIPNFVLLRAFESAARLESFTLAANELHLTQSAISHQIKELEDYFAKPLFIRRNRKVELNSEGKRLLESLSRVFDVIEAACGEVTLAPDAQVLAVHCAPSFAAKWLGPRLASFIKLHPTISIRLTSGPEPIDLIRNREVDVAISYQATLGGAGVIHTPLGLEEILPLCSPKILNLKNSAKTQITQLTLIDSSINQMTWNKWFELNKLPKNGGSRLSFDRAALSISAAVDGLGVVLESRRLAERELIKGELIEVGANQFKKIKEETHFLSYRSGEKSNKKIRLFEEWLLNELKADTTAY